MEDLIMKKLIMFSMVLAVAMPALAAIEDVSPPAWGGTTPSANVVWQIDTEYGVPTCTAYDPYNGDPEIYFGGSEGDQVGTWDSVAGTLEIDDVILMALVEVPGGPGANLTIRVQIAYEGEPEFTGTSLELWDGGRIDIGAGMPTTAVEDPAESGVWVQEGTFTPDTPGLKDSGYLDAGNIIGINNVGTFTITGMIIDVIRHDGDAPTSGPGRYICGFSEPAIAVDSNDLPVYEPQDPCGPPVLGPTDGQLLVSLAWQPGEPTYPAFAAEVVVDPNVDGDAPHEDFVFPDSDADDGSVMLRFTDANWSDPQLVAVRAVEDLDREGDESYPIELTVTIDIADPNFGNPTPVVVTDSVDVVDNDVPFVVAVPPAIEGKLSENDPCVPYCFDVTLSHLPNDDVYVIVDRVSDYELVVESMSVMNPPLGVADDPNRLKFTPGNYDTPQTICLEARDDPCLVEPWEEWIDGMVILTPYSEDVRYNVDWLQPDPYGFPIDVEDSGGEAEEEFVDFDVQDNDCGAVGYARFDFNEDCAVDLGEAAALYNQWLFCTLKDGRSQPGVAIFTDCDAAWNLQEEE
jgi:hypothetical protein